MASLWKHFHAWWNRDALELAEEETRMNEHERDGVKEDFEARIDDTQVEDSGLAGGIADYEQDSEPPSKPAR
jgi:hypothetical protein